MISYSTLDLPVEYLQTEKTYMKAHLHINRNHGYIERTSYTFLDFVGDVGALYEAL